MEEMRKQFEQWRRKECGNPNLIFERKPHNQDAYLNCITQSRWVTYKEAWQASRAALVVELPGWDDFDTTMQVLSAVIEELKSEGITVKEK